MKKLFHLVFLSLLSTWNGPLSSVATAAQPMNVVFILADDLGWADLACYGADLHQTPNLDRLAQQGIRFSNAYAAACICSPTRAAILTGKSPARLGMTIWHEWAVKGPQRERMIGADSIANLPHSEVTLAEVFKAAGYMTAHIGKWHLGDAAYYPETQGYDMNVGGTFWGAPPTYFHPFRGLFGTEEELRYVPGLGPGKPGDYLTDRLTDRALEVMESAGDNPFFLSLWFHTVHTPVEGKPALVEKYRAKLNPEFHHQNPGYAAMVQSLDENVGRVLAKLESLKLAERTIVIFTSDNGGVDFESGGQVVTSNAPLRSGKGTLYEGGLRVPLIVRWPGITTPGSQSTEVVSSQDFFPTLVEGLGLAAQAPEHGELDGLSILPVLRNPKIHLPRDTVYFHYPHYYRRMTPASAVRQGNWKLVQYFEDGHVELYDLERDPGEKTDLASAMPELAARLRNELNNWRQRVGARLPQPNPDYLPPAKP